MNPATQESHSYRRDHRVPEFPDDHPIIIFDGHCALCSGWARFVLRHDHLKRFRLLPAQSNLGHALYLHYGLNPQDYETNILIQDGLAWFESEGSIRMAEGLGFPWSIAKVFRVFPLRFRDRLYQCVARNRFRLFGRRDVCFLAEPGHEERFLK